jgi:hypothetical protein
MGGRSTGDEHDAESDDERDARLHDEFLLSVHPGTSSVPLPYPRRP